MDNPSVCSEHLGAQGGRNEPTCFFIINAITKACVSQPNTTSL